MGLALLALYAAALVAPCASRALRLAPGRSLGTSLLQEGRWARSQGLAGQNLRALHIERNSSSGDVEITRWTERLGNNLIQLEHALLYAERAGADHVYLPPIPKGLEDCASEQYRHVGRNKNAIAWTRCGHIWEVFDVPSEIRVRPRLAGSHVCHLKDQVNEWYFGGIRNVCNNITLVEESRALSEYVRPFLSSKASNAMNGTSNNDDRLTIHMRGGDVFGQQLQNLDHFQPPCAFYRKIIDQGLPGGKRFSDVLIVTEKVHPSPCVEELQRIYPGRVKVQSSSIAEDAGAVLAATNLVGARSTFSFELAKMSRRLKRFHMPKIFEFHGAGWMTECLPHVTSLIYSIPGIDHESWNKGKWNKENNTRGNNFTAVRDFMLGMSVADLPEPAVPCGGRSS